MTLETKHFAIEELKADDETRSVEGFASIFNITDSGKDIVLPGAFAKTIKSGKPAMLWQHRNSDVIGVWEEMEERPKGLFVKGRIVDTALGNDAYKLLKAGAISGLSIGYSPKTYEIDQKKGVRLLKELDLFEVSFVTFPMNDKARVTGVKSRPETIRQFEEYLREAGFSQKDATTVALHGFKALTTQGEPDEEVAKAALAAINNATNILKGSTA